MITKNPLICAIDTTDIYVAENLAEEIGCSVGAFKVGLEFFVKFGPVGVNRLTRSGTLPLFLDLKLHDIPNTVAGAVRAAVDMNSFMLTVHISGGKDMLKAAVDAAYEEADKYGKKRPMIIGVTVLTSMDNDDLQHVGYSSDVKSQVLRMADLAVESGLDGCVCSSHEIGSIRGNFGNDLKLVVPGIRPQTSSFDDQKRVMTPHRAIESGADYIVVGRPITQAKDPLIAVNEIIESIKE